MNDYDLDDPALDDPDDFTDDEPDPPLTPTSAAALTLVQGVRTLTARARRTLRRAEHRGGIALVTKALDAFTAESDALARDIAGLFPDASKRLEATP